MARLLRSDERAEPNLVPILDMVFQLITFFVLVINFQAAALDTSLKLPVVGSARPVDSRGQEDLLILNIDNEGNLGVYGERKDIDSYIASEAFVARMSARQRNPDIQEGDELPTTVVIRADKSIPFKLLNRVMKACQANGFRKFALMAMNKSES